MNQGGKREDFEEESNKDGLEWWERGPSLFKSEDPKPNPLLPEFVHANYSIHSKRADHTTTASRRKMWATQVCTNSQSYSKTPSVC